MKKDAAVIHATPQKPCSPKEKQHFAPILKPSFRTLLFLFAAGMFLFSCEDDKIKPSSEATMTTLTLTVGDKDYEIPFTNTQGKITVPYSTKLPVTAKVAAVQLSAKATGVKIGDTLTISDSEPLTLTVTAEDKTTTQEYTVIVEKATPLSSEASMTSLTLTVGSTDYAVTFTGRQDTLLRVAPYGTPIPATVGVKDIVLSSGAMSDAKDQLSVTNNAVTITVTAADSKTKKTYTVTLGFTTVGITSFTFEVPGNESMALDTADRKRIVGKIDQEAKTITFAQQSAYVYRDKLKATFEVSEPEAAVQVGNEPQASGVTEQDFSAPVSYVVRAEGTETTYRVTLTKSTMATIPYDIFRGLLKGFVPAAFTGDELDIMHSAVTNYNKINLANYTPKLTSLKGIEFLTALDTLTCGANSLTSLDVKKNTALRYLSCGDNGLTSLDLSRNTALVKLQCFNNSLPSLDVRKNTALTYLDCGNNSLTSLDVRENTALMILRCTDNGLTSLDVRENTALTFLQCSNNALTSLDVSGNTALTRLDCYGNALTFLDMTSMRSIESALALNLGLGTAENNPLATLRVNTAVQDHGLISTMKRIRGADLTITTVNDAGEEQCADYAPAENGGTCNQAP